VRQAYQLAGWAAILAWMAIADGLGGTLPGAAQSLAQAEAKPTEAQPSKAKPDAPPSTKAADLTIPARGGVGYNTSAGGYDGYGSFEGFIPLVQTSGKNLLYLQARLLLDNSANVGGNFLLGYRAYSAKSNRLFGGYVAYDNRDTGNNGFSQLGLGLETLGEVWDIRANGYIPVGNTRQTVNETVFDSGLQLSSTRFQNNFLVASGDRLQTKIREVEAAMAGFDIETGVRLARFANGGALRGALGMYYLSGGSESTAGFRARLEATPTNNVMLGLGVQHDGIFGTNVIASIGLTFPGVRPKNAPPDSVLARMGESPSRTNAIVIDNQVDVETIRTLFTDAALQNPATGQPYVFQHVVLGRSGGNGTFENPFGVVQSALNATRSDGNSIVYVQAGSNPGIPAFTVGDRVQMLSTGPLQVLPGNFPGQPVSQVTLPLSNSGLYPNVINTVTLRNDTVLSGFAITSPTAAGVTFNTISKVEIRDNRIANTGDAGILGNDVQVANLLRNTIANAQNQGVYLQNVGTAIVTDNTVTGTRAGTTSIANPITGDLSFPNPLGGPAIVVPNPGSIIPLPSGQGIVIGTASNRVDISRNTIANTATQGVVVLNATGTVAIADNSIANTVGNDAAVVIPTIGTVNVPSGQGIVVGGVNGALEITRNRVTHATTATPRGQGIAVAGVQGTANLTNNGIERAADQGIIVSGSSGTTTIANNRITDITTRIISLPTLPAPLPTIIAAAGGPATGPYNFPTGQGVALINATGTVNVTGNTIERIAGAIATPAILPSSGQGIAAANFSGTLNLTIANNQIRNTFNDGMILAFGGNAPSAATGTVSITGNTIENNGGATPIRGDGIAIALEQAANISNLLIENNTIRGNSDDGIDIRLASTATALSPATASVTGTIRNNQISTPAGAAGQNGVEVRAQSNTTVRLAIESNTITTSNAGFRPIDVFTENSFLVGGTPRIATDVQLNTLTSNPADPAVRFRTTGTGAQVACINLDGNSSNSGYTLANSGTLGATLRVVNQATVGARNTGTVTQTGTITSVPVCP
jgi:trimeric autotransporter adhesin